MTFLRMLDMANDSPLFRTHDQLQAEGWRLEGNVFRKGNERYVPLYEAKMVHHFDHRYGDYADYPAGSESTSLPTVPVERLANPGYVIEPRYWVPESEVAERLRDKWSCGWLLGWRDICRNADERTVITSVLPSVGVGHKFLLILPSVRTAGLTAALVADLTSLVFDYVARQKIGGTSLPYFTMRQLPLLAPAGLTGAALWDTSTVVSGWTVPRVLELSFTAHDLAPFARDLGYSGPPFRWDPDRRFLLRAELDAAFFHLYGISRADADYILETFPIVKRDDVKAHGEYRTKRVILECYDAMQRAIETGKPYQTILDPPPADPRVAHAMPAVPAPAAPAAPAAVPAAPAPAPPPAPATSPFPLRRVEPAEADKYRTCVPLVTLKAAAGAFGEAQSVEPDGWVAVPSSRKLRHGMFVAQVVGRSMEPLIPDGAWCLFAAPVAGSRQGKIVLVEHHQIHDAETGGSYTVKRYESEKAPRDRDTWEHTEIRLLPLNPAFSPIVLEGVADDGIKVVAEFVCALGG